MRKTENDPFEYLVWVNKADYDDVRGGWNYIVRQEDGTVYADWVKETNLKRA